MNNEAREALVAAALRGHRQIRGRFHDRTAPEGECALGVLHLALHTDRAAALACQSSAQDPYWEVATAFEIPLTEWTEIYERNDRGEDFLTIARKVGYQS